MRELLGQVPQRNMILRPILLPLSSLALTVSSLSAATYQVIFDLETVAATAGAELGGTPSFLDTVIAEGDKAYAFIRGNGGGAIVEYDGASESYRTVMDNATWGGTSSALLGGFYGAAVTGGGSSLTFANTFDNQAYSVDITTGLVTTRVTSGVFEAATGGSVNLTAASHFTSLGNGFAYDGSSDSILGVGTDDAVSVVVTSASLTALMGNDTVSAMMATNGILYIGSNSSDSLYSWDLAMNTGSTLLTTAQIESVTDDQDGRAGFVSIFSAPDGLTYFYENDSDSILSMDLNDPINSLSVVLTEDDLINGPAGSDSVGQLTWYDGEIAWTNLRQGFNAVPEPSSSLILGMAGLIGLGFRRRA